MEFLKAAFMVGHFWYYTLVTFLIILSVYCYLCDDTTSYSKCDQASDLWQQLELTCELESDLWDIVDWGRKWLVDFNFFT